MAWVVFVCLYLGVFFWNFFIELPNRLIPTIYIYILIIWLSIEFYMRQPFFQSGRLITEEPKTKERYDQMNFSLRTLFAIFFYSCIALGVADFVWWKKWQMSGLVPYINVIGIIVLLVSVFIRLRADLIIQRQGNKIIKDSLYGRMRHPAYFAALLLVLSISLALSSLLALVYACVVGLPIIYLEANFEDNYLARKFGADYQNYKKETNLFIDGIL